MIDPFNMSPAAWAARQAAENPRVEITAENMRLGAPAHGSAYERAVRDIEEAKKALAENDGTVDHTAGSKKPSVYRPGDSHADKLIRDAERDLRR